MTRLSRAVAAIAFIALIGMILVTLGDIGLRLISRLPGNVGRWFPAAVPGVVDLVELSLVTAAHLSIAVTFLAGSHVVVDIVANLLPTNLRSLSRRIGWMLCVLFMATCFVQALRQGRMQFGAGIVSATISLPVWWYWVPVVVGTALSTVACALHLFGYKPADSGKA
jgi:TRAP-type C4-dicarboxylate transport system permease small subunit